MNSADEIWNRAAMQGGGPAPRSGDVAFAAALRLHSLALSGGLVDASVVFAQQNWMRLSPATAGWDSTRLPW